MGMAESERIGLASHLSVKLRRTHRRVVDVTWMEQNDEYAREILRIARDDPDPETVKIVQRFEELLGINKPMAPPPAPEPPPVVKPKAKPATVLDKELAKHYTGHLR
jgi:hypothetical protein